VDLAAVIGSVNLVQEREEFLGAAAGEAAAVTWPVAVAVAVFSAANRFVVP